MRPDFKSFKESFKDLFPGVNKVHNKRSFLII